MTNVQCSVMNCAYNSERHCNAEKIQISNVNTSPDMEAGEIATSTPSATSFQTQCVTFKDEQNKGRNKTEK